MKKTYLLILLVCSIAQLFAQTGREVRGIVQDTTGNGVIGATVKLGRIGAVTDTMSTRTNFDGSFVFREVTTSQFTLTVSSLGYRPVVVRSLNSEGLTVDFKTVKLSAQIRAVFEME